MKKITKILVLAMVLLSFGTGVNLYSNSKVEQKTANAMVVTSTYALKPDNGNGSSSNPYLIQGSDSGDELAWIAQQVNSGTDKDMYFELRNNVDLGGKIWTPIGSNSNYFEGNFNGNGYSIQNMIIDKSIETSAVGFFGYVKASAIIRDVVIENPFIVTNEPYAGALIGFVNRSSDSSADVIVSNVAVEGGSVKYEGSSAGYVGGIVGRVDNYDLILDNSYSSATLIENSSGTDYIGGLIGSNGESGTSIKNAYFTGLIYTNSTYNPVTNGTRPGRRNVYYAYGYNDGATQYGYYSSSNPSSATTGLTNMNNFTLSRFGSAQTDSWDSPQNNWIHEEDSSGNFKDLYLRGVGNRTLVLKQKDGSTFYLDMTNNSYTNYASQSLSSTSNLDVSLYVTEAEYTWGNYEVLRKLGGTSTTTSINTMPNNNRISKSATTVRIMPSTQDRQGYFVVNVEEVDMLFKQTISIKTVSKDRTTSTINHTENYIKKISGEVRLNSTTTSAGTNVTGWTHEINDEILEQGHDQNGILEFYATQNSKVQLYSYKEKPYHEMFLYATDVESYDSDEKTVTTKNTQGSITVYLSDMYLLNFATGDGLFNGITKYETPSFSPSQTKYYISASDGGLFTIRGTSKTTFDDSERNGYPTPTLSSYDFKGWYYGGLQFSNGKINVATTDPTKINIGSYGHLDSMVVEDASLDAPSERSYYTTNPTDMEASWVEKTFDVTFKSYLNLDGDPPTDEIRLEQDTYVQYYLYELGDEVSIKVTPNGASSVTSNQSSSALRVKTDQVINLDYGTDGYGYRLGSFMIMEEVTGDPLEMLGMGNTATFASSYSYGNDFVWYKEITSGDTSGIDINNLHGNLHIIALFERSEFTIDANFTLEKPSTEDTGFELNYKVLEINQYVFDTGTLTYDPETFTREGTLKDLDGNANTSFSIEGLFPGQIIVFSMELNKGKTHDKFRFSSGSMSNVISNDDGIEENIYYIADSNPDTWFVSEFLTSADEGLLETDKEVDFGVSISYIGIELNMFLAELNGENVTELSQSVPSMTINVAGEQTNISNTVYNVQSDSVFSVELQTEKYWSVATAEPIVKVYTDIDGVQTEVSENIEVTYVDGEYEVSSFADLTTFGQDEYDVYLIFEKTQYEVEIEAGENAEKLNVSLNGSDITFSSNSYTYNVEYDENSDLIFNADAANGYEIKEVELTVYKDLSTRSVTLANSGGSFNYSFDPSTLETDGFTIEKGYNIRFTFDVEPVLHEYIVNFYKEVDFSRSFEIAESLNVEAYVGESVSIAPDPDLYTGYVYDSDNASNALSGIVTYDPKLELNVYYERIQVTVIYDGNGNDAGLAPVTTGSSYKYEQTFNTAYNTFLKTGNDFTNWNTASNNSKYSYNENQEITVDETFIAEASSGEVTLFAIWEERVLTITYTATDADDFSNNWSNKTDYTTSATEKFATSQVTYGYEYSYINGVNYSNLITPSRYGYDFDGWYTEENGQGQRIEAGTIVAASGHTQELFANWIRQTVEVTFKLNATGIIVEFSYTVKELYVGDKYVDMDITTLNNTGFPIINSWTGSQVYTDNIKWSLDSDPLSATYLTSVSTVGEVAKVNVYAHWTVADPVIDISLTDYSEWVFETTYTGENLQTLNIGDNSSNDVYISNYGSSQSGIYYTYQWYKEDGTILDAETQAVLTLKNHSDSGLYYVETTAHHATWGDSSTATSGVGQVIINRSKIDITLTEESISKIYDGNTEFTAFNNSDSTTISIDAEFDNQYVETGKTVTFTVDYDSNRDPNNYDVYYEETLIENAANDMQIIFTDSTAQITPYTIIIDIGSQSGFANGTNHSVIIEDSLLTSENISFLGARDHIISGNIATSDKVAGVYTGATLVQNIQIEERLTSTDRISNYEFVVNGTYEIIQGVLKTLVIDKEAILDKDSPSSNSVNTDSFIISYNGTDISATDEYNVSGTYFNVVNNDNTNQIVISSDEHFVGSVLISSVSFEHTVSETQTIAVAHKWVLAGQDDVYSTQFGYSFNNIAADQTKTATVNYLNYSTIVYKGRLANISDYEVTVYNTSAGVEISHITNTEHSDLTQPGVTLLGWFDGTGELANEAPTTWSGIGEVNLYAKWSLNDPDILIYNDDVQEQVINQTYDGEEHSISVLIQNQNDNLEYTYSWKNSSNITTSSETYEYQDVITDTITLTFTVDLVYDGVFQDYKEATEEISLTVTKYDLTITERITKTYDGSDQIETVEGNFIVHNFTIGSASESLKVIGNYASIYAGVNITIENLEAMNYSSYKVSNYNITFDVLGDITPKELIDVEIGDETENYKVYDTTALRATKEDVANDGLVASNKLSVVFETNDKDVGVYSASSSQILLVSFVVMDGAVDVTASYTIANLFGSAEITNYILDTTDIAYNDNTTTYDGQERDVAVADFSALSGGDLPSDITPVYTWTKQGDATVHNYPENPKDAGIYFVNLTLVADPSNYLIVGDNPIAVQYTIEVRDITINLGTIVEEGQGVKTYTVDSAEETYAINNLPLPAGHYVNGNVQTNSNLPGTYTQASGLVNNLVIYDELDADATSNYSIIITGSVEIIHYYYIEYNINGIGSGSMTTKQAEYAEFVTIATNKFVIDGYDFDYWYTDSDPANAGTRYDEGDVESNLTETHKATVNLYAIWKPATDTKYYIEYYLQNLDLTYDASTTIKDVYMGTTETVIELTPNFKDGSSELIENFDFNVYENDATTLIETLSFDKQFEGFTIKTNALEVFSGEITPQSAGSMVLKIYYERNTYTLTLHENRIVDGNASVIEIDYLFEELAPEPSVPTRAGYTFTGWYYDYPSESMYEVSWPYQMPAQDVVLWAVQIPDQNTPYIIEEYYQSVDGSFSEDPDTIYKAGQTDSYIEIEYVENSGNITSATLRNYETDQKLVQLGLDEEIEISKTGFYLANNAGQNLEGTIVAEGDSLVLKIYYQREEYTLTKVLYNGESDIVTVHKYQETILEPSVPEYTGYDFVDWYYDYDAGTYQNAVSWNITIVQDLTIHAKWTPSTNTNYTLNIYYENTDGTYEASPDLVKNYQATTNYYAEFMEEASSNIISVYTTPAKTLREIVEGPFDYQGFHVNNGLSTFTTNIEPDGSGEITVYYERDLYQVTYVYNNGDSDSLSAQTKFEDTIAKPTDPTYVGYVFSGWYFEDTFENQVSWPHTILNGTTTMYAKWVNASDIVYTMQTYLQLPDTTYPASPTQETFTGTTTHYVVVEQELGVWNLNIYEDNTKTVLDTFVKSIEIEGYTYFQNGEVIEKEILPDGSMVINLYYTLNSYTFYAEKNNGQAQDEQTVKYNQEPAALTDPTKQGYVFADWYTNIELTTLYDANTFKMPASDYTVYAKWTPATNTAYVLEYYLQNIDLTYEALATETKNFTGTTDTFMAIENGVLKTYETPAKLSEIKTEGTKVFIGFSITTHANEVLEGSIAPDGSLVLKLYLERNTYSVTLNYNDGVTAQKVINGVVFADEVVESIPQRAGYDFVAWYYEDTFTTKANWVVDSGNGTLTYIMEASNVEMYAKWSARNDTPYDVEHYIQNVGDDNFTLFETISYQGVTDTTVEAIKQSYPGFTFDEANASNILSGNLEGDGSLVLEVYYSRDYYDVVFYGNGSTSGTMDNQTFKFEQIQNLSQNEYIRDGYDFAGWTTHENSLTIDYLNQGTFAFNKAEIQYLWALWTIKDLTVAEILSSDADNTIAYGETITLTVNISHDAEADITYDWYKDDVLMANIGNTLEINEISESGRYYVNVLVQGTNAQGVRNNVTTELTDEVVIVVSQRNIYLEINQNTFTYNASSQYPTFTLEYFTDSIVEFPTRAITLPDTSYVLTKDSVEVLETTNAGIYSLDITVSEDSNFTLSGDTSFAYEIQTINWDISSFISVGEFEKEYALPSNADPILEKQILNPSTNEQVTIYFEREAGEAIALYDLSLAATPSDNDNYNITLGADNQGFRIKSSSTAVAEITFINASLLTKEYDGQEINTQTNPAFDLSNISIEFGATLISAEFEIKNSSANVGAYEVVLTSAVSLEYNNVEMGAVYYFTITQRNVEYDGTPISKIYDKTLDYEGIGFTNVLAEDVSNIRIDGTFLDENVGTDINIFVSLNGTAKTNYKLGSSFIGVVGEITPRNIKIYSEGDFFYEYGSITDINHHTYLVYQENLATGEYDVPADPAQASCTMTLNPMLPKLEVGVYSIVMDSSTISANYNFVEFVGGSVTITPKVLQVTADWNKTYDTTTNFDGEITIIGVVGDDDVSVTAQYQSADVGEDITLDLTLQGVDAGNYVLESQTALGNIEYSYVTAQLDYNFDELLTEDHSQPTETSFNLIYNMSILDSGYLSMPQPTATGYNLLGWFDQEIGGNQVDENTMIQEPFWTNGLSEKTFYARWDVGVVEVEVGVVTYDSQNYEIETTDGSALVGGSFAINGTTYEDDGSTQTVTFNQITTITAAPNADYDFVGWFTSASISESPITTGAQYTVSAMQIQILMRANEKVFAKFKLKTALVTLYSNADTTPAIIESGYLDWTKEKVGENLVRMTKEIDYHQSIDLPTALQLTRQGYELEGWWTTQNPLPTDILMTGQVSVSETLNLYAIWEATSYLATFVANTGQEDELLLNVDNGHFENPTDPLEPGEFIIPVNFEEAIGAIEAPIRDRYVFVAWYENPEFTGQEVTAETIYLYESNHTFYAKWTEATYTATITINERFSGNIYVDESIGVLSVNTQTVARNQIVTVNMLSTVSFEFTLVANKGYVIDYSSSLVQDVDAIINQANNDGEITLTHTQFNTDFTYDVTFKSILHQVDIEVNNINKGSIIVEIQSTLAQNLRSEARDDLAIVEDLSAGDTQNLRVMAYSGEIITITINAVQGYKLASLLIIGGDGSYGDVNLNEVTYANFKEASSLQVVFEEQTNYIRVNAGQDLTLGEQSSTVGSFAVSVRDSEGVVRVLNDNAELNNNFANVEIKTGETLILSISVNYGFNVSQEALNYIYTPENIAFATGSFELSDIQNGNLEFSGFNSDGSIVLPFERQDYSFEAKVGYFEAGIFEGVTENESSYVSIDVKTLADREELGISYYNYQKEVEVDGVPQTGYEFVGWYSSLEESGFVTVQTLTQLQITQNTQIYAVVKLVTLTLTYEAVGNGMIDLNSPVVEVLYGRDGPSIQAIADDGYQFEEWQIFDGNDYITDLSVTESTRQDLAVTQNATYRAVFVASDVTVQITSTYIEYEDANGASVYGSDMSELIGSVSLFDGSLSGTEFNFVTQTGNQVRLIATAQEGYELKGWLLTLPDGKFAKITENTSIYDVFVEDFTTDITITAVFETSSNVFDIALVQKLNSGFDFNSNQYIEGGSISIDPSLFLQTGQYQSHVVAAVRTGLDFNITVFIKQGFTLIYDENDETKAMIGVRYNGETQINFVQDMTITETFGTYSNEITFNIANFTKGGDIVVYLDQQTYSVVFNKTQTEQRLYDLQINSTFTEIDLDYLYPTREGYIFRGWFSQPDGQGTNYIDKNGVVLLEWRVEHTALYAMWEVGYVRYNIIGNPSLSVLEGPLGWTTRQDQLKQYINSVTFEYYVGSQGIALVAPDGIDGYLFSHWEKDGQIVSELHQYVFDIPVDIGIYEENLYLVYAVRVVAEATTGGSASIQGVENVYTHLLEGEEATLVANVEEGYNFVGWRRKGTQQILSEELSYTVYYNSSEQVFEAVFEGKEIEIQIVNSENGVVDDILVNGVKLDAVDGKYYGKLDNEISFNVSPENGYVLTGWEINGVTTSSFEYYLITIEDLEQTKLEFKPIYVLVSISYQIMFDNTKARVEVAGEEVSSLRIFETDYYQTVNFTFDDNVRYSFTELRLNGVVLEDVVRQNGLSYVVSISAEYFDLTKINEIEINSAMVIWTDSRQEFAGLGTEQNPYEISSAEHFAQMSYLINNNVGVDSNNKVEYASAYYQLTVSIDFEAGFWTPIGTQENPFDGIITLEYSRTNIVLDNSYTETRLDGLFGYVTENAQFEEPEKDIKTGIIIFSSIAGGLLSIVSTFVTITLTKRKRLRMQSRIFPTERITKK